MTPTEIMNQTFHHLAKQGKQAITESGACRYRGADGTKCALGFWIKDEDYNFSLEGKGAYDDGVMAALPPEFKEHRTFLAKLQELHDDAGNWLSPQRLFEKMANFANYCSLQLDPTLEAEIVANWKGAAE